MISQRIQERQFCPFKTKNILKKVNKKLNPDILSNPCRQPKVHEISKNHIINKSFNFFLEKHRIRQPPFLNEIIKRRNTRIKKLPRKFENQIQNRPSNKLHNISNDRHFGSSLHPLAGIHIRQLVNYSIPLNFARSEVIN